MRVVAHSAFDPKGAIAVYAAHRQDGREADLADPGQTGDAPLELGEEGGLRFVVRITQRRQGNFRGQNVSAD